MGFTLITVTYGGEVGHSRGYETLYMCEQAKSLALTGRTIEANKALDEHLAAQAQEEADKWRSAHPPRKPTTQEEIKIASGGFMARWSSQPYTTVGEDGLLYDWPGNGSGSWTISTSEYHAWENGRYVSKTKRDIKHAECIIEPTATVDA